MFLRDIPGQTSGDIVGTPASDLLVATSFGELNDDTIQGAQGDDVIAGSHGSDIMLGGEGNDTISGASLNGNRIITQGGGFFGQDTLTGGQGSDIFFLGGSFEGSLEAVFGADVSAVVLTSFYPPTDTTPNNYYDAVGNQDYALITDFNSAEDVIHLDGLKDDYSLGATPPNLPIGIGIFQQDELIAIVQGDTALDLEADYFQGSVI